MDTHRIYEEYATVWFKFYMCGLQHLQDRDKSFEASH